MERPPPFRNDAAEIPRGIRDRYQGIHRFVFSTAATVED